MEPIIIGIDTGNKQIKTATQIIPAGIKYSDSAQAVFQDGESMMYNGKNYVLTSDRNSYKRDKTIDDDYFALSLVAIVRELRERGFDVTNKEDPIKVVLVVGLPPAHFARQKDRFRDYFNRGVVLFEISGVSAAINIVNVHVMIQGYAAVFDRYSEISGYENAYIVDIGGYTTDVIELQSGKTNPAVCFSEDAGMIHLYNMIKDDLNSKFDDVPKEHQIDRLLYDPLYGDQLEPGMMDAAMATARNYVKELMLRLQEKGINLRISKGIFVGGGAARLRFIIEKSDFIRDPIFVTDVKANALGYEAIVKYKYKRR